MADLEKYAKAIVPVIVGGIITALGYFGVGPEVTLKEALTLVVTAGLVWLVPNKK
jgi:hypothetical protein